MDDNKFCDLKLNKLIDSARGLNQYIIATDSGEKIVTVIGELHKMDFVCKGESFSIYDYCKSRIQDNKNCKCLLEYNNNCDYDISRIGSTVIQDVFSSKNIVRTKTTGIDSRTDFLTPLTQNTLYNGVVDKSTIHEYYIKPYFKNRHKIDCNKKLEKYMKIIDDEFNECKLNQHVDILKLKWAWLMVMDYNIIDQIFKNNNITEYVIVVGENHRINLYNTMNDLFNDSVKILKNESKKGSKCISTESLKKVC